MPTSTTIVSGAAAIEALAKYHPICIEGPSSDSRDPSLVAANICRALRMHWQKHQLPEHAQKIIIIRAFVAPQHYCVADAPLANALSSTLVGCRG